MQISKKIALQLPKPRVSESRPVEVGTNIEVEALLVSGHCLKLFILALFVDSGVRGQKRQLVPGSAGGEARNSLTKYSL